jgi:predicted lipoprotein with Yx(FWY)xxD motif
VHPVNDQPVLDGVTGDVGVITGTDGKPQLTLNGLPLYYYLKDTAPGDVLGQAKSEVWWVVAPDGSKITG